MYNVFLNCISLLLYNISNVHWKISFCIEVAIEKDVNILHRFMSERPRLSNSGVLLCTVFIANVWL